MKRYFCLFLVVIMLLSVLASCKKDPETPEQPTDNSSEEDSGTKEPEVADRTWDDLPTTQYDKDVVILGRESDPWSSYDLVFSKENPTRLDEKVVVRNTMVEDRHKVTLKMDTYTGDPAVVQVLDNLQLNNMMDKYAFCALSPSDWAQTLIKGYFVDLQKVTEVDLSEAWWDQSFVAGLTLYDQLYGVASDATYVDKMATWIAIFNVDVLTNYAPNYSKSDLYTLVDEGEWTVAKMLELAETVNFKAEDATKVDYKDPNSGRFGIADECVNLDYLFSACNMPYATYQDGNIVYNLADRTETCDSVFQAIFKLVADSDLTYMADAHSGAWAAGRQLFADNRTLFFIGGANNLTQYFTDFACDYGVLPLPKYSTEQANYCSTISTNCGILLAIPTKGADTSMAATVMQAMACSGRDVVRPEYYDIALRLNGVQDPDSVRMLDTIFNNRIFDLGTIFKFGALAGDTNSKIADLVWKNTPNQFKSTVDAYKNLANSKIEELLAFYDKNYQ